MKKYSGLSIFLSLPVFLFYASHFANLFAEESIVPTGFIQSDQVSYMANAKEYGERGGWAIQYPLPFSMNYDNEAIYFQPQLFVLGQIMRIIPVDPGILFMLFGFLFTVLCIRICIVIFIETIKVDNQISQFIGIILFIWGGGLLCIGGGLWEVFIGNSFQSGPMAIFSLDPGRGWWFLNLGRNFVYPMEAYYHFLFFAVVYCVYKKRYNFFLFLLAILSLSHPFTGTAALLISFVWICLEQYYVRRISIPKYVLPILSVLFVFHFGYYLFYLGSNADHALLMKRWALDWSMTAESFLLAYALVGLMVLLRVSSPKKLLVVFSNPFNRFLIVWAFINFLLENHEFAIPAHQPLHFTRGYTWSALFLLGYPVVQEWVSKIYCRFSIRFAKVVCSFLFILFLSDNLIWFALCGGQQSTELGGIKVNPNQEEILLFLSSLDANKRVLISRDYYISYLSTVYTEFRPIYAHAFNTPDYKKKMKIQDDFVQRCIEAEEIRGKKKLVVYDLEQENCFKEGGEEIFKRGRYLVCIFD